MFTGRESADAEKGRNIGKLEGGAEKHVERGSRISPVAEKILFAKTRNMCYDSSHSPDQGVARRWGREIVRDRSFETFCTQLETRVDFFYFFAHNPLKSPDSDE